jgi:hypothetical protein
LIGVGGLADGARINGIKSRSHLVGKRTGQVHAKRARASSASKAQNEHFKKPDRNHKHCERYRIVLKPIPI